MCVRNIDQQKLVYQKNIPAAVAAQHDTAAAAS